MTVIQGTIAAEGIAAAKALVLESGHLNGNRIAITADRVHTEQTAFAAALQKTVAEIERLKTKAYTDGAEEQGDIFSAYLEIVGDESLSEDVCRCIEEKLVSVNTALMDVCNAYAADMAALDDPYMQARADDFRQIFRMIAEMHSGGGEGGTQPSTTENFILVGKEIGPADTARIDRRLLKGIVVENGSRTSHAAIICRASGIPMLSGIQYQDAHITTGVPLIIDGELGTLVVAPDEATAQDYAEKSRELEQTRVRLNQWRGKQACTADGVTISVMANAGVLSDIDAVLENNAEGIGLFRTEFLFMENPDRLPNEQEQFEAYKTVLTRMGNKPVVFRTLDAGGDKNISALGIPKEENPFLGWRAIRYCLKTPEVFRVQLRALVRASVFGNERIMLPMISSEQELLQARKLLDSVYEELKARGEGPFPTIPLGIMIETPAAALTAATLARSADFFSIGSNDLTQYTVAVDRGNEYVADLYDELHPAVLTLIRQTVAAAADAGIGVHICGEMAGDTRCVEALLQAGLRELSMSANRIPHIKEFLSELRIGNR